MGEAYQRIIPSAFLPCRRESSLRNNHSGSITTAALRSGRPVDQRVVQTELHNVQRPQLYVCTHRLRAASSTASPSRARHPARRCSAPLPCPARPPRRQTSSPAIPIDQHASRPSGSRFRRYPDQAPCALPGLPTHALRELLRLREHALRVVGRDGVDQLGLQRLAGREPMSLERDLAQ